MKLVVTALLLVLQSVWSTEVTNKCQFNSEVSQVIKDGVAKIAPLIGHSYTSYETRGLDTYKYTVGICDNPIREESSHPEAAVLQQKMVNGEPTDTRVIGVLSSSHIMSGADWAFLEYTGGEVYHKSCNKESKRAVIMLQCDETVDDSKAKLIFLAEENSKTEACFYLFEMKHKSVCLAYSSSSGLSVGSILLIVFLSLTTVYLLLGFLYSRFVLGSKGMEQIPNYEFWKDFGNLQADGCDFVCRTRDRRQPSGFGGLGDDQLDHPEEIRDDNLLPM